MRLDGPNSPAPTCGKPRNVVRAFTLGLNPEKSAPTRSFGAAREMSGLGPEAAVPVLAGIRTPCNPRAKREGAPLTPPTGRRL